MLHSSRGQCNSPFTAKILLTNDLWILIYRTSSVSFRHLESLGGQIIDPWNLLHSNPWLNAGFYSYQQGPQTNDAWWKIKYENRRGFLILDYMLGILFKALRYCMSAKPVRIIMWPAVQVTPGLLFTIGVSNLVLKCVCWFLSYNYPRIQWCTRRVPV